MEADVSDVLAFADRCNAAPARLTQELTIAMDRAVLRVQNAARQQVPVDTGRLRNSIKSTVRGGGGQITGTVGTNVVYARPVHDGRAAIVIVPTNRKALAFTVNGAKVVVRRVSQPARPGNPFLRRALDQARPAVRAEFEKAAIRVADWVAAS